MFGSKHVVTLLATTLLLKVSCSPVSAFYLPGLSPKDYTEGSIVELDVNSLNSPDSLLPYDYYDSRFGFCTPPKIISKHETLGSILFGDRLKNSPFKLEMLKNVECKLLCSVSLNNEQVAFLKKAIDADYRHSWFVDGLPVAMLMTDLKTNNRFYSVGFPLGSKDRNVETIHNHFRLLIQYHKATFDSSYRIVGVLIEPYSIKNNHECKFKSPSLEDRQTLDIPLLRSSLAVDYTYSVEWKESSVSWGTRWDNYLYTFDPNIHWFSIVNSIGIVLILTGMLALILLRALHKDISRYNSIMDDESGVYEDFGWKTLHADVFRQPTGNMLLSVFVGSGSQILAMASVTLVLALFGVLSPSSRGSLTTIGVFCYVCFASIAGFVASYNYRLYGGTSVRRTVFFTALAVPLSIFSILVLLNFLLVLSKSSAAVPFGTMLLLVLLWLVISIPSCFFGAYYSTKFEPMSLPVKTNQIPRQIPSQPFYLNYFISIIVAGILPFGAIFIELYFIMDSMWLNKTYFVFGFLSLVFVIAMLTCSEVSMLMCYFQLCSEDYRWQWRSFMASASCGLYVLIYEIVFLYYKLQMVNTPSTILYVGWSLVISALSSLAAGTIGYFSTLFFVKKIFSSIKVD